MKPDSARQRRRSLVTVNYLFLVVMNVCFYVVYHYRDMTHLVDVLGLSALALVALTFYRVHAKSGLWKLTHSCTDDLDERELQQVHTALRYAYSIFTVLCLLILLAHAVLFRLVPTVTFVITVPLVGSLIYLAHTLPGSILAWTESEVPGEAP